MTSITVTWDGDGLQRMQAAVEKLSGRNTDDALRRALNHTGDKARTVVKREVAKQAGLSQGDLMRYGGIRIDRANYGSLAYTIYSSGRHIPLRAFKARQTRRGVTAAPWNTRRTFRHTFMVASMGGHVFKRVAASRGPIKKLWGPSVAKELVRDPTAAAWRQVAHTLPARVEHEVRVITDGVVS